MKAIGEMIYKMASELRHGVMAQSTKVTTKKEPSTARENTYGTINLCTMENGLRTKSMAMVFMNGLMEDAMMVSGRIITCMDVDFTLGEMVGSMKVSMLMTAKTDMVHTSGLMEDNTGATGRMESSTAKDITSQPTERKREVFGKRGKESSGLMNDEKSFTYILILLLQS